VTVALAVIIVLIVLAFVATLWAVRKMLAEHNEALATVIRRRAADLAHSLAGAEGALRDHVTAEIEGLARPVQELADVSKAVFLHQRTVSAQDGEAGPAGGNESAGAVPDAAGDVAETPPVDVT
jgi:hypothetical protein